MIKLMCGDCLERLKEIADNSVDLVVMDPPYLINAKSSSGCFGADNKKYREETKPLTDGYDMGVIQELLRVMKKINIYIWCNKTQIPLYFEIFTELGCNFDILMWHKSNPVPACGNKYLTDTEYTLFFREKGVKIYGDYNSKKTYRISPTNKLDKKKFCHPTVKPVEIISDYIKNSSNPNEIVLDPFMGSGTTGVACVNMGRNFIGIEIDKGYYKTAKNRIKEAKQCMSQ